MGRAESGIFQPKSFMVSAIEPKSPPLPRSRVAAAPPLISRVAAARTARSGGHSASRAHGSEIHACPSSLRPRPRRRTRPGRICVVAVTAVRPQRTEGTAGGGSLFHCGRASRSGRRGRNCTETGGDSGGGVTASPGVSLRYLFPRTSTHAKSRPFALDRSSGHEGCDL